jgi:hypothetical protein
MKINETGDKNEMISKYKQNRKLNQTRNKKPR